MVPMDVFSIQIYHRWEILLLPCCLDHGPLSKPQCQVDWEKPDHLCCGVCSIHELKQAAHGIFVGIFYWSAFFLHKTQCRGEVQTEGLVSCLFTYRLGSYKVSSQVSEAAPCHESNYISVVGLQSHLHLTLRRYPSRQVVENWKEVCWLLHIISKSPIRCRALLYLPGM